MAEADEVKIWIIDRDSLPPKWPTHRHTPEFWEQLGRAIASFGFLEDVLRTAIFAFTGTGPTPPEKAETDQLVPIMTDQLWNLAKTFEDAANKNPNTTIKNISELVAAIKDSATVRNTLCHGSWMVPDSDGKSLPRFVRKDRKTGELLVSENKIDIQYLSQVHDHVADLSCAVIDTVTHMGYQFPGGAGPGKPVWARP